MDGSEVRARIEHLNSVFALQEGDSEGVNPTDMFVKIEGSWSCVSREGSVVLTHRTQRGERCMPATQGLRTWPELNLFGSPGSLQAYMATYG